MPCHSCVTQRNALCCACLLDEEGDELRGGDYVAGEERVAAAVRGVYAHAAAHDERAEDAEPGHVEPHRSVSISNTRISIVLLC